jgi:hypothetical protein
LISQREKKIKNLEWRLTNKEISHDKRIEAAYNRIKETEWLYWEPILAGLVQVSKAEYDEASPSFLYEMNALARIKAEMENEKYERMFGSSNNGNP